MDTALKTLLLITFIVASITGMNLLFGGITNVPGAEGFSSSAIDSELRFLSTFWILYGVFCLWVASNIKARGFFIPMIALIMLVAGMARLISFFIAGHPGQVLFAAMIVEFVLPVILISLNLKRVKTKPA
ncbi:MAG: DUF4345 domain-containing protein [Cellvibrionales bacterium]|nr:DUF4345 domain-containing protein [Cellvibrionales bacterium]